MQRVQVNRKLFGTILIVLGLAVIVVNGLIQNSFEEHGVFLCDAVSANPALDMAQCPAHTSSIPTLVSIGFVLGALVMVFGVILMLQITPLSNKTPKRKIDLSNVHGDAKKVCELLIQSSGTMYQSELIKKTEISKVKMTRILDHLEHDLQIVERKRRGMTNIVILR